MGERRALIVGIDGYPAPIPSLAFCELDALAVEEQLAGGNYGFQCVGLLGAEATRPAILAALLQEAEAPIAAETFVFFFAGHGGVTSLAQYLVTPDSAPYTEGVEMATVVDLLTRVAGRDTNVIALLDCCHAGYATLSRATSIQPLLEEGIRAAFARASGSRAVLAACAADQQAKENPALEHGLFTYHLLEALSGAAADAEGNVTPNSLHDYVSAQLKKTGAQTPAYSASLAGSVSVGSGFAPRLAPSAPEATLRAYVDEGSRLVEDYRRRVAEIGVTADWATDGYRSMAAYLSQLVTWFSRRAAEYPELVNDPSFAASAYVVQQQQSQAAVLNPGLVISEGTIDSTIGHGGFGTVWKLSTAGAGQFA